MKQKRLRYMQNDVETQICKIFYRDFCKVFPKLIPYLTHLPFGEQRNASVGKKLKDMGATRGWPDYLLARPCAGFHSLFLEFKTKRGRLSEQQKMRMEVLRGQGFAVCVVRGSAQAIDVIDLYTKHMFLGRPDFEYKPIKCHEKTTNRDSDTQRDDAEYQ